MQEIKNPAAAFLVSAGGNWRNAIYIYCDACDKVGKACGGFLMIPGADAIPILVAAQDIAGLLGCDVEREECASVLTLAQFEKLYAAWLLWAIDDPKTCVLRQLTQCGLRGNHII